MAFCTKTTLLRWSLCMAWLISSCVERVDLELDQTAGQLVVDTLVSTDTSNVQSVTLSRAVPFSSVKNNEEIQGISGAEVMVSDDQGNSFSFNELTDPQRLQPSVPVDEGTFEGVAMDQKIRDPEQTDNRPDFRSTLIWTDILNDRVSKLDLVTTDFARTYLVRVSGINQQGEVMFYQHKVVLNFQPNK